jgi:hypothetical protein
MMNQSKAKKGDKTRKKEKKRRKKMGFKQKLDIVLKLNRLGINSPSGLENKIPTGKGAILKPYNNDEFPGPSTQKKIVEYFGISQKWWDTGEGDVFATDKTAKEIFTEETESVSFMRNMWHKVKTDSDEKQKEIDRLWRLIDRLDLPGDLIKRVPANDR